MKLYKEYGVTYRKEQDGHHSRVQQLQLCGRILH